MIRLPLASRRLKIHDYSATEKGVAFSIGFDFHDYLSIVQATPTKDSPGPVFRPDRSPINSGEGYWIMGADRNNEVVLLEAVRLYDLSHTNFAAHLESLKVFYGDPAKHAHPQDRCTCTAPSAKTITGKVAYYGDLWVRQDLRGAGLSKIAARLGGDISFALWAPDFVAWIVRRSALDKIGIHQRVHHEPGGILLRLVEEGIDDDYCLGWQTGEERAGSANLNSSITGVSA